MASLITTRRNLLKSGGATAAAAGLGAGATGTACRDRRRPPRRATGLAIHPARRGWWARWNAVG